MSASATAGAARSDVAGTVGAQPTLPVLLNPEAKRMKMTSNDHRAVDRALKR